MRRPIVDGNWKMHGSRSENARLIEELLAHSPARPAAACVICPPFVYLQEVGRLLRDSVFSLGGQDVCADAQGAFTGEVSAAMLKDVGCEYVIVGHSERRLLYRESDSLVARKFGVRLFTSDQHRTPACIDLLRMPVGFLEREDENLLQHLDHIIVSVIVIIQQHNTVKRCMLPSLDNRRSRRRCRRGESLCHEFV